jgi:hypothetical protein
VLIGLCSAKGSPGVTVSALALTLTWPGPVILAECDPAGGDLAAGFLREIRLDGRGLAPLGASLRRDRLAQDLWGQLVDLDPRAGAAMSRLVLPGFAAPGQARAWSDATVPGRPDGWQQLAALFAQLSSSSRTDGSGGPDGDLAGAGGRFDVIADCGRLAVPHAPLGVLAAADLVLLVARPQLGSVRAAAVALAELSHHGIDPVGLVMVGDGSYSPSECARHLGVDLVVVLPADPGTAWVLSESGRGHRGRLLRAAAHVGAVLVGTPHPRRPVTPPSRGRDRSRLPGSVPVERHGPDLALGRRGESSHVR